MEFSVKMVPVQETFSDSSSCQTWINPAHIVYVRPVESKSRPDARSEIKLAVGDSTEYIYAKERPDTIASKIGC